MRNSFSSLLAAAILAFGLAVGAPDLGERRKHHENLRQQWKQAQAGNDWRPELAPVSGAMPYQAKAVPASTPAPTSQSAPFPWSQPAAPASATASNVGAEPKRHETMREPMEKRQSGGNDRRSELAPVSGAMPYAPRLRRRPGGVCAGAGSPPAPAPPLSQAPSSLGGSSQLQLRRRGAPANSGAGEYATELAARAQCPSDTIVWADTPSRIYHYSGTPLLRANRSGAYMCEANARAAGYRAAKNRQREAGTPSG